MVLVLASAWLLPTTFILGSGTRRVTIRSRFAGPAAIGAAHNRRHQGYQWSLSAADQAKGDPGGTITGTVNDIPVTDTKAGLSLADIVNTVGQNQSRSTSSGRW